MMETPYSLTDSSTSLNPPKRRFDHRELSMEVMGMFETGDTSDLSPKQRRRLQVWSGINQTLGGGLVPNSVQATGKLTSEDADPVYLNLKQAVKKMSEIGAQDETLEQFNHRRDLYRIEERKMTRREYNRYAAAIGAPTEPDAWYW